MSFLETAGPLLPSPSIFSQAPLSAFHVLFPDVAITWYSYICPYGHLPVPVHNYYFSLVSHYQFVHLYLEDPQDLSLDILNPP